MSEKQLTNEEKLDEIYRMTLEDHEVLRTMRRQQYISGALRVAYWLVVLGVIGGAYLYVRPFIGVAIENSTKIRDTFFQLGNQLPEAKVLNTLLQGLKQSAGSGQ